MHRFLCPSSLLIASLVPAQQTWIVDRLGGAGVHFTDLPPALAAAVAGDVVIVRANPQPYTAGTATRGIKLLADPTGPGSFTRIAPGMFVVGVPANEAFTMYGFLCDNSSATAITASACAGRVCLDFLNVTSSFNNPAIVVQQCAAVTIHRSSLRGSPGLEIVGSRVAATQCDVGGRPQSAGAAGPACTVNASIVDISEGIWQGGGATFTPPTPSAPAVDAINGSTLTVTGGNGFTAVTAGGGPMPPAGIQLGQATLSIDPVVITGGVSGGTVTTQRIPAIRVQGSNPLAAQLRTEPGDLMGFAIGLPGVALALPSLGDLWIDPAAILLTAAGVQPAGSQLAGFPLVMIPASVPVGTSLAYQAVVGNATGLRLSHPVVLVVK